MHPLQLDHELRRIRIVLLCLRTSIEDATSHVHLPSMRVQSLSLLLLWTNTSMAITEDDGNGHAPAEEAIKDGPLERCRTVL